MELCHSIIKGCQKNDRKAQHALYMLFASKMYGVCLRYYPNKDIANDILQDGFIKVFNNIKSFKFQGSVEGWIRRIMVNTALEYHRKKKDSQEVDIDSAFLYSINNFTIDNDYKLLLSIVASLPKQYQLVFNLYAIEGYSHAEIAKELNISESTSKSNYSRARAILKKKVMKVEKFEGYAAV